MSSSPPQTWQVRAEADPPADWDDFLGDCPDANIFYTTLWTRAVCHNIPGTRAVWLTVRFENRLVGGMVAVLCRRGPLLKFVSHYDGTSGGPLIVSDLTPDRQDRLFGSLVAAFASLHQNRVWVRTFSLPAVLEQRYGSILQDTSWRRQEIQAAIMPLAGGLEHVEMHVLKKNRRNERNRSLKRGCSYGVTNAPDILREYYPIYRAAAERWGITPTPLGLLRDMLTAEGDHTFLTYAQFEDSVIGGHLNFHWGDRVIAWNGATRPEHDDKFPATLLIWADLEEACRRQASWLDLGGHGGKSSLANFKRLLGAEGEIRGHYLLASRLQKICNKIRRFNCERENGS